MRKAMVTRTFTTLSVTATVLNVKDNTVSTKELTLSRVVPEKKILKKLQEVYNTNDEKVVHFTAFKEVNEVRGMDEQEFYEKSVPLDGNRKVADATSETEGESDDTENEPTATENAEEN